MKKLSIEEKAKAYDEALEKAKKLYEKGTITESINYVFPELTESEDEKIRKEIVRFIQMEVEDEIVGNKWIAWLEKQKSVEEIVARCKKSWYNEGKIDGKFEGIADDVKYQQGWHDAIEKQGEQNPAWSEEEQMIASRIASVLEEAASEHAFMSTKRLIGDKEVIEIEDWLKSLKERIGG